MAKVSVLDDISAWAYFWQRHTAVIFPTLNLKEKSGFNFMSASGASLFLAFPLYCSHTAKTYTKLRSLIIQSMEITNARSHGACYGPLKSNLGTAIKAETLLLLTLLFHRCWSGNTRALSRLQSFTSKYVMGRTVFSKGATDLHLESVEAVSGQHFQYEAWS